MGLPRLSVLQPDNASAEQLSQAIVLTQTLKKIEEAQEAGETDTVELLEVALEVLLEAMTPIEAYKRLRPIFSPFLNKTPSSSVL